MKVISSAKKRVLKCYSRLSGISELISFPFLHLLFLFCIILFCAPVSRAQFRAAVVKIDITPADSQYLQGYRSRKSKSTGVHDHIFHRIVALDDGNTQFFIVASDLCLFSPSEYDKVTAKLQSQYGISPLNIWWSVTHGHSSPKVGGSVSLDGNATNQPQFNADYTAMIEKKLVEGIIEARQKLAPARLGVGWGFSLANINRRAIDIDGKASIGLNPDAAVDRRIGLLRIDKKDGSPLALIANYPMHGTVMDWHNMEISGDAPGIVSEYVEQKIGVPMLFINGAAGNLAPIYSVYPNPKEGHLNQFRVLLGDKILDANGKITSTTDTVKLVTGSLTIETPRKPGLGWSSDLSKYTNTTKAGINMVRLPIRFLKINKDIAIWSAPIELFCEVANEVRSRSPFPYTFYFGYTNGWLSYLPTEAAWQQGGYEPSASPFTPSAAKDLAESVVSYLQSEMRSWN